MGVQSSSSNWPSSASESSNEVGLLRLGDSRWALSHAPDKGGTMDPTSMGGGPPHTTKAEPLENRDRAKPTGIMPTDGGDADSRAPAHGPDCWPPKPATHEVKLSRVCLSTIWATAKDPVHPVCPVKRST